MKSKHQSAGFSLVENLVALVVLSIGMLGMAALYMEGLKAERTSIFRVAAISLASDMADRIRSNPNAQGDYALPAVNNVCQNGAADCTRTQMAQDDKFHWEAQIAQRVPGGAGVVEVVPQVGTTIYRIVVSWVEAGSPDLQDYTLVIQI